MACPVSSITAETWDLLRLVNDCTTAEHTDLIHLPYPGTVLDQPEGFLEAVRIVRSERAAHQRERMETERTKKRGR